MLRAFAVAASFTFALQAQTLDAVLVPVADTTLYEDAAGAIANGAGESLFVGVNALGQKRRAIVRFDVASALPAHARVVAVELRLQVAQGSTATPLVVTVHRVTSSWSEGTANATLGREGQGTTAGPGDSTWLHRSLPTPWQNPGGDFDPAPHGAGALPQFGTAIWPSTGDMVADVQHWLDVPADNHGWLLHSDELVAQEARRLHSRSTSAPGGAPRLVVTWATPGTWAALLSGCPAPQPKLTLGGPLRIGTVIEIAMSGPPGLLGAGAIAPALQFPRVEVAPGCSWWLPATAQVLAPHVLDAGGSAIDLLAVPRTTALSGLALAVQGALFDAAAPLGFSLSNAGFAVVR